MSGAGDPFAQREIALVDLLDRLLAGGVVLAGDITLRIADVDLVRIDLKALISSVNAQVQAPWPDADEQSGLRELDERDERDEREAS
ncbi:gas vesicle protein [Streptomyces aureocirculatus]|uniref:gas vesicle protein n=1 Tax=Streptomyces aureocirculatus TaxID=67275 RepID=UPI00068AE952|nr:gas vesicle protein [Streptomyces aureocirculatus]